MSRSANGGPPYASRTCRECGNSFDWEAFGSAGQLIFCKCPYHKAGRWCKFLSDRACPRFKPRRAKT